MNAALHLLGILVMLLAGQARPDALLARLAENVRSRTDLPAEKRAELLAALVAPEAAEDVEQVYLDTLAGLSADFSAGLEAWDNEDYAACRRIMDGLADLDDVFVRNAAATLAARSMVRAGDSLGAAPRLAVLQAHAAELREATPFAAEVHYLLGYCQAQNLQSAQAAVTLRDFLAAWPAAPDYLLTNARQILADLGGRVPGTLAEAADLMGFAGRRLNVGDGGDQVREAQQRTISILDELIRQAEELEAQSTRSAAAPAGRQNRSAPRGNPESTQPMPDSRTQPGGSRDTNRSGRQVQPGAAWGDLPPAEREKVLQVLRERFPGRYRALVEQYYQSLAEEP